MANKEIDGGVAILSDEITCDLERMGGTPCFRGTRVPVDTLLDHLAHGYTIDYVAEQFPTVEREQLVRVLTDLQRTYNAPAAAIRQSAKFYADLAARKAAERQATLGAEAADGTDDAPGRPATARRADKVPA